MAKHEVNITGTTDNQLLARVITPRGEDGYGASVFLKFNSGSGTATVQVSPDGGTTKYTVVDTSGVDITGTANAYHNFVLGIPNKNSDAINIYADLTGGSSADIDVILYDKV